MIITRKGSLMPRVFFGSAGHVMYVVLRKAERGFRISHGAKHAVRVPSLSLDLIPEDRQEEMAVTVRSQQPAGLPVSRGRVSDKASGGTS